MTLMIHLSFLRYAKILVQHIKYWNNKNWIFRGAMNRLKWRFLFYFKAVLIGRISSTTNEKNIFRLCERLEAGGDTGLALWLSELLLLPTSPIRTESKSRRPLVRRKILKPCGIHWKSNGPWRSYRFDGILRGYLWGSGRFACCVARHKCSSEWLQDQSWAARLTVASDFHENVALCHGVAKRYGCRTLRIELQTSPICLETMASAEIDITSWLAMQATCELLANEIPKSYTPGQVSLVQPLWKQGTL